MSSFVMEKVIKKFSKYVIESHSYLGNETVVIKKDIFIKLIDFIKNNRQTSMNMLVDITCVDYPQKNDRFMLVYHFYSTSTYKRLRIKVPLSLEDPYIDSLTSIWKSANWLEREVYDMFGIKFNNHPNLKRILLYESFEGHPLRKDYPINKRQPIIGPLN